MLKRQLCLLIALSAARCAPAPIAPPQPVPGMTAFQFRAASGDSVAADSGRLRVRENRQRRDSRDIEIAFVRVPGARGGTAIPTFYISGGSGSGIAAMRGPRFPFFMQLRTLGDVVTFDLRGTGHSVPALTCDASLGVDVSIPLTRAALVTATRNVNRVCGDSLRARGFDPGGYNGREVVEDIEELRRSLGADRIRIMGASTGTHLALEYVRKYPQHVAVAYMLGTEGPGQTDHLPGGADSALLAFSERQRQQNPEAPAISELARRVFTALDERPVTVGNVSIGGYDARVFVSSTLGDRRQLAQLPQMLGAMSAGRFEMLAPMKAQALRAPFQSVWESLHDCQAGTAEERKRAVQREAPGALLGHATLDFAEACDGWGVDELPPTFRQPVRSSVPTLFVSGTFDGRTPVANAEEVRTLFTHSAHLIVDGASHGDLFLATPAILQSVLDFPQNGMRGVVRVRVE